MNKNSIIIDILNADNKTLTKISNENLLSLTLEEMKTIKNYYKKIKRNPTDVELETIAQTWSEHCKHKTLRGKVEYSYYDPKTKKMKKKFINNLLKNTIVKATKELDKKWCLSVFEDNAGVIEFDKSNGIAFKVETHNHPSALEPYGGAGTGIGGVIRDILGVGLGAKPICNTDIFCFGYPDTKWSDLPKGTLHPRRVMKGVVEGVRDYGNRMGIPTVNGAVLFDEKFVCNPLVYCGTVGIMPKKYVKKDVKPGDYILAVGGRTGRDGIHGATFSSLTLDENTEVSAVQIGNPIIEKKVLDTMLKARDMNLYRGVTDCGAGGFSSAVGELGEKTGCEVELSNSLLKYDGLKPWEIWVSEAQERMVFAVQPKNLKKLVKIFEDEDVETQVLGKFTDTNKLVLKYKGELVCDLDMDFLHNGLPQITQKAVWKGIKQILRPVKFKGKNYSDFIRKMLSHPNVCSKEWIIRQYDHEVQAGTVIKPLQGKGNGGPGDASVIKPLFNSNKGVAVSCGINFEYGKIDPYQMTLNAIDESLRNLTCVGAGLEKAALLDNFCWGDPNDSKELAGIVQASMACYKAAKAYDIPFISGKDSLNNTFTDKYGKKISIPGTLLISSIAIVKDIRQSTTMYAKKSGNYLYLVGKTKNEFGGSLYSQITGESYTTVPQVDLKNAKKTMDKVSSAIRKKYIVSAHDLSEGGLAVSASEMAFSGNKGIKISLDKINMKKDGSDQNTVKLFSESPTRFLVEVPVKKVKDFEKYMKQVTCKRIGEIIQEAKFQVFESGNKLLFEESIDKLRNAWANFNM
ncbi:phosphoribosylformylglycinamidine synthase subunit PurL [bacterium]